MTMTDAFRNRRSRRLVAALVLAGLLAATAVWSAGQVTGKYMGNDKPAKIAHVAIVSGDPWQGEKVYTIVIAEKDPASVKKPDFDAMFGKLGDALVIGVTRKGEVISTQVCHQALKKSGFSASGSTYVEGFKIDGNQLSGRFFTKEKEEFFGDTWEFNLTVKAPLPKG